MSKKKTIVEMFEEIKAVPGLSAEQVAFLDKRIELVKKKNASGAEGERKLTKDQVANEGIKEQIIAVLANVPAPGMTIGDICKAVGIESNQKISALVSQMLTIRKGEINPNGKVVRTEVKGKAHFALASQE